MRAWLRFILEELRGLLLFLVCGAMAEDGPVRNGAW